MYVLRSQAAGELRQARSHWLEWLGPQHKGIGFKCCGAEVLGRILEPGFCMGTDFLY